MRASGAQRQSFDELLHTYGTQLSYKKAEFIIRPREILHDVFLIESGLVKAYDITKYGEENLLIIRRPAEVFPLIWAITGEERAIMYEAMTPCVLWRLPRDRMTEFVASHPDGYAPLLDMVVDMYRVHAERIFTLEYRTVRERLVSFLLWMTGRFGRATADGILIDAPLRHQDIASSINASRETTGREIAVLERQGLISNKNTSITVYDETRLRHLLG